MKRKLLSLVLTCSLILAACGSGTGEKAPTAGNPSGTSETAKEGADTETEEKASSDAAENSESPEDSESAKAPDSKWLNPGKGESVQDIVGRIKEGDGEKGEDENVNENETSSGSGVLDVVNSPVSELEYVGDMYIEYRYPALTLGYYSIADGEMVTDSAHAGLAKSLDSYNKKVKALCEEEKKSLAEMAEDAQADGASFAQFTLTYDAYVTRADMKAMSFYEQSYEFAGGAHGSSAWTTHNYDSETGSELGFKDVFTDVDSLPALFADGFRSAYSDMTFDSNIEDRIRQSIETGDEQILFSLSYGCVHIFAQDYFLTSHTGGQKITLSYSDYPDLVKKEWQTEPDEWILPLNYYSDYMIDNKRVSMDWEYTGVDDVDWNFSVNGNKHNEKFFAYQPNCYLVKAKGLSLLYLRIPVGDVSMISNVYEITNTDLKLIEQIDYAPYSKFSLNPNRMLLSLNEYVDQSPSMLLPYGEYHVDYDGLPVINEEVYGLEGNDVILKEAARVNPPDPEDAAVSGGMWNLAKGTRLTPLRTDRKTYVDYITEMDQVCRFGIDKFAYDMQLDNFGTPEDIFERAD
ncbi:MAG: DUF4163 domain-containing protein [Lachnospiraceae bacterium]|nr:DUF4163 domain-containing protein [Lachnospiraceae bacterium]